MTRGWRLAALGLLVVLGVQSFRLRAAERRIGAVLLRADSLEAANDTTRSIAERAQRVLGDSLHGVERRAIQEKQRADALDRALGRERIARVGLEARVDSLRLITGAVIDTVVDGARSITFEIDTIPYYGRAIVWVPPQTILAGGDSMVSPRPERPTLDLRLSVTPIPLSLRLGCGEAVQGIRPATVTLYGPRWATLSLDSLSQSPDLCRSPALQPRGPRRLTWIGVGALVATGIRLLVR